MEEGGNPNAKWYLVFTSFWLISASSALKKCEETSGLKRNVTLWVRTLLRRLHSSTSMVGAPVWTSKSLWWLVLSPQWEVATWLLFGTKEANQTRMATSKEPTKSSGFWMTKQIFNTNISTGLHTYNHLLSVGFLTEICCLQSLVLMLKQV